MTSQNTESFYEANECDLQDQEAEQKKESKSITDFEVVRGLGKGAFGQVYLVKDKVKSK